MSSALGNTYDARITKKLRWMDKYLETLPETLVLFVDGYDVIVLENGEEIVDRFLRLMFLCSSQLRGRPHPKLLEKYKNRYPKAPASSRYLNSGLYIGSVREVKKMIRGALSFSQLSSDDQALMSLEFLDNLENRRLDYKSEIFFLLFSCNRPKESVHLGNSKIKFVTTGSSPCIAHGNGKTLSYDLYIAIYRHFFDDLSDGEDGDPRDVGRAMHFPSHLCEVIQN